MSLKDFGKAAAGAIPAAIAGVGNYLGGRESAKATREANKTNAAIARDNLMFQQKAAHEGVQWKVLDARKAGINPLAALGAQTFSPSPVSAGAVPESNGQIAANLGQDISRAASAVMTHGERTAATTQATMMNGLQIENQALQNDLLRSQISRMHQGVGPGFPTPLASNANTPLLTGQGNSSASTGGYVLEKPMERVHSSPGQPAQEVGTVPDYGFAQTPTGLAIVPSKDVKEKIEDQFIPEMAWAVRNQLLPNLGIGGPTPPNPKYYPPPSGSSHWVWNPLYQEFQGNRQVDESTFGRLRRAFRGETLKQRKESR